MITMSLIMMLLMSTEVDDFLDFDNGNFDGDDYPS
jgi:hypothetical protein